MSQSTAMVMLGWSVHLTTLFSWASLTKPLINQYFVHILLLVTLLESAEERRMTIKLILWPIYIFVLTELRSWCLNVQANTFFLVINIFHREQWQTSLEKQLGRMLLEEVTISKETYSHLWLSKGNPDPSGSAHELTHLFCCLPWELNHGPLNLKSSTLHNAAFHRLLRLKQPPGAEIHHN